MTQYQVVQPLHTVCCHTIIGPGEILDFFKQTSPRRIVVRRQNGQYHKVRLGALIRCSVKVEP